MQNRAELLEHIRAARAQLEWTLASLSDDQLTNTRLPNQWSVKDLLAHLGWWERRIVNSYHTLLQGAIPDPELDELPVNELNARVLAAYQRRTLAEVRLEEAEAYRDILALAEIAPEADLFDPNRFAWTEGRPFYEWISSNTYEHFEEHLRDFGRE